MASTFSDSASTGTSDLEGALGSLNQPLASFPKRARTFVTWEEQLIRGPSPAEVALLHEDDRAYSWGEILGLHLRLVPHLAKVVFPKNRWARERGGSARGLAAAEFGIRFTPDTPSEYLAEVFLDRIYTRREDFLPSFKGVVLDVGAQFGDFALLCAKGLGAQQVIAFEPVPWVFQLLEANVRLNQVSSIALHRAFICDDVAGGARDLAEPPVQPSRSSDPPEVRTLDSYHFERVTLLKVDVEGHELRVLRGARELIRRERPHIILETHSLRLDREVERLLVGLGYVRAGDLEITVFPVPGFDRCRNVFYAPVAPGKN